MPKPPVKKITRRYDKKNLVGELARNKVDALELLREALSNAKDHGANRVWIKTTRGRGSSGPDILLMNDGLGMGEDELSAFWGVSTSIKPDKAIGHKGHGTKLYFASRRLSVATRCAGEDSWRFTELEHPDHSDLDEVDEQLLPAQHRIAKELDAAGLADVSQGVAILIEGCTFPDATSRLLSRRAVESYCDWFTVIGDVRSGLFKTRREFHEVVKTRNGRYEALRVSEVPLRPLHLELAINGESGYRPMGLGPTPRDKEFLEPWTDDRKAHQANDPGLLGFGHRFADHHESESGAKRVRDDLTSLCLTSAEDFVDDPEFAIIIRVEGHRRQRETYLEAKGSAGEYNFDERFGLWLCKDFIPVMQQNEWLRDAIGRAAQKRNRLRRYDLKTLRNWHVFVNSQDFTLTANRNDISNLRNVRERIVALLASRIERAFEEQAFADWVRNLQNAVIRGERDREVGQMNRRLDAVTDWFSSKAGVEPARVTALTRLDQQESLRLPEPKNEQELFHLYAVLSGVFRMPLRVLEYDAREGIDAVAQVRDEALFRPERLTTARVEFKNSISGNTPIGHYFDAIDALICWEVGLLGPIREGSDAPSQGELRKRKPKLASGMDTHEIVYQTSKGEERILPVVCVKHLFKPKPTVRSRKR